MSRLISETLACYYSSHGLEPVDVQLAREMRAAAWERRAETGELEAVIDLELEVARRIKAAGYLLVLAD